MYCIVYLCVYNNEYMKRDTDTVDIADTDRKKERAKERERESAL